MDEHTRNELVEPASVLNDGQGFNLLRDQLAELERAVTAPNSSSASRTAQVTRWVRNLVGLGGSNDPLPTSSVVAAVTSAPVATDGYTRYIHALQARVVAASQIRELPTWRVLRRMQNSTEKEDLDDLKTNDLVHKLKTAGSRRRAKMFARAESADARRGMESNINVRALALARCRKRWTLIGWAVLLLALAFMCVNVQAFAAAGAQPGSPQWIVAWGVDPLLSMLVVGLLLSRGDLAAFGFPMSKIGGPSKLVILGVEIIILLSELGMNVAPELAPGKAANPALVVLHVVVPMAAVAAAVVLPIVQGYYASAITALYTERNQFDSGPPAAVASKPQRRSSKKTTEPAKTVTAKAEGEPVKKSSVVESKQSETASPISIEHAFERPDWVTSDMTPSAAMNRFLDEHGETGGAVLEKWAASLGLAQDFKPGLGRTVLLRWKSKRDSEQAVAVGGE